jgi:hypothetical protein
MMIRLTFILIASAALALAADGSGWRKDPGHPQLEYRVTCSREALSIIWRNGYPGEVTLKAHVKSESYDGFEDAKVLPGGTFKSDPETMYCSLSSLNVSVVKFTMAAPPPPPKPVITENKPKPVAAEPPAPEAVPTLVRFDSHAEKLPEIAPEKLAQISNGMSRDDVVAKLGPPASKLAVQNDGEFLESYQYRLGGNKISIVRFLNGAVSEVTVPQ